MRLTDHPEARAELLEAARFYRRSGPALVKRFRDEIAHAIAAIQEHPERWRLVAANVRCYRLTHFPYTILYSVTADGLEGFAYKHHSRRPDYWRGRLTD